MDLPLYGSVFLLAFSDPLVSVFCITRSESVWLVRRMVVIKNKMYFIFLCCFIRFKRTCCLVFVFRFWFSLSMIGHLACKCLPVLSTSFWPAQHLSTQLSLLKILNGTILKEERLDIICRFWFRLVKVSLPVFYSLEPCVVLCDLLRKCNVCE